MQYQGVLGAPITARRLRAPSNAAAKLEAERIAAERMAKLSLLAQAHGVPEGDWLALAMALAITHVPGFGLVSEANGDGRWTEFDKAQLRLEVDAVRAATGKSVDTAIQEVVRAEHWRVRCRHLSAAALRQYCQQARPEWIDHVQMARRATPAQAGK